MIYLQKVWYGIKSKYKVGLVRLSAKLMRGLHISELANKIRGPQIENAFKTVKQGASTVIWCAVSKESDNIGGVYCEDCNIAQVVDNVRDIPYGVRNYAINIDNANKLWELSKQLI